MRKSESTSSVVTVIAWPNTPSPPWMERMRRHRTFGMNATAVIIARMSAAAREDSVRDLLSRQLRRMRRLVFPRLRAPDLVPVGAREPALEALYRLVLGRPIDEGGRRHYVRLMRD